MVSGQTDGAIYDQLINIENISASAIASSYVISRTLNTSTTHLFQNAVIIAAPPLISIKIIRIATLIAIAGDESYSRYHGALRGRVGSKMKNTESTNRRYTNKTALKALFIVPFPIPVLSRGLYLFTVCQGTLLVPVTAS